MDSFGAAKRPWEVLALETLSFLPRSENGYRFVLAVLDVGSRWLELLPLHSKDPLELAFVLEQNVFLTFGPSTSAILPTHKTEFGGPFLKILKKYEVHKGSLEQAHPQLMTMIGRCLKEAKRSLQQMMHEFPSVPWDHLLKHVTYRFRTRRHANMKSSPQKMVLTFRGENNATNTNNEDDDNDVLMNDKKVEKKSSLGETDTIKAPRNNRQALFQEREWFQTNVERFCRLSLSLKAEALRSKMMLDPSAAVASFGASVKKKTSANNRKLSSMKAVVANRSQAWLG